MMFGLFFMMLTWYFMMFGGIHGSRINPEGLLRRVCVKDSVRS
jgi:hypothetical protein